MILIDPRAGHEPRGKLKIALGCDYRNDWFAKPQRNSIREARRQQRFAERVGWFFAGAMSVGLWWVLFQLMR